MTDFKYGFTCGAWDLLHAGHVEFLRQCSEQCYVLIVGLHVDPSAERINKNKPIQSVYERFIQLTGCRYVNKIIPYQTEKDLKDILAIEKIDVRFLGSDYQTMHITGKEIMERRNIKTVFIGRDHLFGSSELRARVVANHISSDPAMFVWQGPS